MRLWQLRYVAFLIQIIILLFLASGCSTQKNTARSRWWHAFNARYNTYYNGTVAYIDASLEKENGHQDNFTELLPLYPVSSKSSRELGKANFERAVEKSKKAIKLHSIKKRPEWRSGKRKTAITTPYRASPGLKRCPRKTPGSKPRWCPRGPLTGLSREKSREASPTWAGSQSALKTAVSRGSGALRKRFLQSTRATRWSSLPGLMRPLRVFSGDSPISRFLRCPHPSVTAWRKAE